MALRLFLLLLLLLAATLLITQTQGIGSSASDCCLRYSRKAIPTVVVASYRHQGPESGCLLRAVVFITKRNRKICASPKDEDVRKLMEHLDKKAGNDKDKKAGNDKDKTKAQTQRPKGRPRKQRRQRV